MHAGAGMIRFDPLFTSTLKNISWLQGMPCKLRLPVTYTRLPNCVQAAPLRSVSSPFRDQLPPHIPLLRAAKPPPTALERFYVGSLVQSACPFPPLTPFIHKTSHSARYSGSAPIWLPSCARRLQTRQHRSSGPYFPFPLIVVSSITSTKFDATYWNDTKKIHILHPPQSRSMHTFSLCMNTYLQASVSLFCLNYLAHLTDVLPIRCMDPLIVMTMSHLHTSFRGWSPTRPPGRPKVTFPNVTEYPVAPFYVAAVFLHILVQLATDVMPAHVRGPSPLYALPFGQLSDLLAQNFAQQIGQFYPGFICHGPLRLPVPPF